MCEHIAGLVDVCVSVFAHVYMCMWNPETNLGCSSSSVIHLDLGRQNFHKNLRLRK